MPSRRAVLTGLAAGGVVAAGGYTVLASSTDPEPLPDATPGPDDWPAAGYDARNTRYNAAASVPRSKPENRWSVDFDHCYDPFVRGDRVVLNAEQRMVGIREQDGERVWRSEWEPWGMETPTLGAERAYVTGVDCVFGVDLATGDRTWHGDPCRGANTASGTIADGRLYLEHGGYFSALDATGQAKWATTSDARGSPAIDDDTAFVATAFTVEAVDLTTPAREWPWEDRDDDEPPHTDRDAATRWSEPTDGRINGPRFYWSPAVTDSTVYATAEREDAPGGELRALDRASGDERWAVASPPRRRPGEEPRDAPDPVGRPVAPVVTDDRVVTSLGDRVLRAFSYDGTGGWTHSFDHAVTELAGAGDTLVAVTHDRSVGLKGPGHGTVHALDLASGRVLWSWSIEHHFEGLALTDGRIYTTRGIDRQRDEDLVGERLLALA